MTAPASSRKHSFTAYLQPKTLQMLVLGFSSGIPFFLVGNTLSYWLREQGITLTAIGLASGVGLAYSLKFLWAPLIDRVDAPLFGFMGRRRGWILLAQIFVAAGLIGMAAVGMRPGPDVAEVAPHVGRSTNVYLPAGPGAFICTVVGARSSGGIKFLYARAATFVEQVKLREDQVLLPKAKSEEESVAVLLLDP